jgi:hypothetical protein
MIATESNIKFCKDFLISQLSKLPVEYPEGYVERKVNKSAMPKVKPAGTAPKKPTAITIKKLGTSEEAKVMIPSFEDATVKDLKEAAGRAFNLTEPSAVFSLVCKGRPLSDLDFKLSSVLPDTSVPIHINIKSTGAAPLNDTFFKELKELLQKHGQSATSSEKICTQFTQQYPKWF